MFSLLERRLGLRPEPAQTPRERAAAAASLLSDHPAARGLAEFPGRVVELFYRLRYGDRPLTDTERHSIEEGLTRLKAALGAE